MPHALEVVALRLPEGMEALFQKMVAMPGYRHILAAAEQFHGFHLHIAVLVVDAGRDDAHAEILPQKETDHAAVSGDDLLSGIDAFVNKGIFSFQAKGIKAVLAKQPAGPGQGKGCLMFIIRLRQGQKLANALVQAAFWACLLPFPQGLLQALGKIHLCPLKRGIHTQKLTGPAEAGAMPGLGLMPYLRAELMGHLMLQYLQHHRPGMAGNKIHTQADFLLLS